VNLKPFFCFYGGKWRVAPHYPAPEHTMVVEPFAGASGAGLLHCGSRACDAMPRCLCTCGRCRQLRGEKTTR
jgi:hypothetical protein